MKFVGLSGGIGSGKSSAGARLAVKGADVIDVDGISRQLQEPGGPLFEQMVARWGTGILDADGRLDREAFGRVVFQDRSQLGELTMMAAPLTENELVRRALLHVGTDDVVVVEAALYLVPMYGMEGLLVVDVPVEVAVSRLVDQRRMSEDDARARIAAQLPPEARLEHAGFVIDNRGDLERLDELVDAAWTWIHELPDATPTLQRAGYRIGHE